MRYALSLALLVLASAVHARPYFRVRPLSKVETGGFYRLGVAEDHVLVGVVTPVVWHDSKDGYWLIPGVDWSLLNAGWAVPAGSNKGLLFLGPSVSLDEPIKAWLRQGLRHFDRNREGWGFLKAILAPNKPGEKGVHLSVGPMWALDTSNWRGALVVGTTLSGRF